MSKPTPTERLPKTIKVAGYSFSIELWSADTSHDMRRYGECSTQMQAIRLRRDFVTPEKAVDTFLHELMHAIYWAFGVRDEDDEERTVNLLGTGLMTVHRDNPWLAGWIEQTLVEAAW